jgi:hypothetical protein
MAVDWMPPPELQTIFSSWSSSSALRLFAEAVFAQVRLQYLLLRRTDSKGCPQWEQNNVIIR